MKSVNNTYEKVSTTDICALLDMVFFLKKQLEEGFPDYREAANQGSYWAEVIDTNGKLLYGWKTTKERKKV